jgi:outer membrane protein insertion porin family
MFNRIIIYIFFILSFFSANLSAEELKKIIINGNDRIADETIIMFSSVSIDDELFPEDTNKILKSLYESNFFENVSVSLRDDTLIIDVIENPLIEKISYEGIKSTNIKKKITENLNLKSRSSYNEFLLKKDKERIQSNLKELGYYFSKTDIFVKNLEENKVDITFQIDLGAKARIKKISFIGDKIFKDKKLKSIIVSEEYKFWKFISGKKYLNENIIKIDERLLKNFYLNKGYFNVEINSSYAKAIDDLSFELIFNIQPNKKIFFNDLSLKLPDDFNIENYSSITYLFKDLKDKPYSINKIEKILNEIDKISINEQYESINASVLENIDNEKLNLTFVIEETDKKFIKKINIFGNNITREDVIRNQFEIDEGDPFNNILINRTINNIKNLNFFKSVNKEVIDSDNSKSKIINISIEEKATGEISAGAGVGTSGGTVSFGVKENNYLGKGISVLANASINKESLKGILSVNNPNFNNSDKSIYFTAQAIETDRLTISGYKTNKTGLSIGTKFEYQNDFYLGIGNSNFYETIDTDSTASERQKTQKGNYWDSTLNLNFDYDKRNQKFQTTEGFRSRYFLDIPIVSETYALSNTFNFTKYSELYEDNVSAFSIYLRAANSINNKDIKLSERIFLPSDKLRGFVRGKVGPKDGEDFIGGNYAASLNFSSTVPQILENSENVDFLFFIDVANLWGVDYFKGDDESNEIRSSAGIGIDWLTPVGPLNFTLAQPISKSSSDITESFRFNLGTTF